MNLSIVLLLIVIHAWGQRTGSTVSSVNGFVRDSAKPYVYLQLDRIGPREPRSKDEPIVGIYLRLINNTKLTVFVSTIGSAASPEGDVADKVVSNSKPLITISGGEFVPLPTARESQNKEPPPQEPPLGYDVAEVTVGIPIPPGGQFAFSVPINHVGPTWHFEIPFRFDLPKTHQRQPESYVSFFEDDLPPKDQQSVPPAK
jgi:hypothetical protein